ncbi:MAG: MFS transporter [Deltaproteobacteria bacterium]|nr:MFS transporter [Deltaproteobacteria bacterium]
MPAERNNRWLVLAMFMVAHGVNDGFSWIIPPLLPFLREYFQLSYADMGVLFSAFQFTGSIMQAPAAYLVNWMPASTVLAGGLIWSSLGMFLTSFSLSYTALLWLSAVSGFGRATYHPLAVSILSRIFGRDTLGRAVGLHLSGSGIAMVTAPLLVGLLLTRYSWRVPIQIWSSFGLLAGFGLAFYLRHHHKEVNPRHRIFSWPFFSWPLVFYLAGSSVWGIAQGGVTAFTALFLVDQRQFRPEAAAAVYGLMAISGLICRPFLGALMDRMGRRKPVIIAGYIIAALSILGLIFITHQWALYIPLFLLGIFGAGHSGLADTFMIESIPSQRREETLGFVYTFRMGISAAAPLIVGILSERTTIQYSFFIMAFLPGCAALLISRAEEKPKD